MVCGGTWLNRKSWDDAKAEHRAQSQVFDDFVRPQQQQAAIKQGTTAPPSSPFNSPGLAANSPLLPLTPPAGQSTFLRNLLATVQNVFTTAQNKAGLPVARPGQAPAEGVIARVLGFFFGSRRENRMAKVLTEAEQDNREATEFEEQAADLFSLSKVAGSGQGQGIGTGD